MSWQNWINLMWKQFWSYFYISFLNFFLLEIKFNLIFFLFRLLQNYHSFFPCPNCGGVCRMLSCIVSTNWWTSKADWGWVSKSYLNMHLMIIHLLVTESGRKSECATWIGLSWQNWMFLNIITVLRCSYIFFTCRYTFLIIYHLVVGCSFRRKQHWRREKHYGLAAAYCISSKSLYWNESMNTCCFGLGWYNGLQFIISDFFLFLFL